MGGSQKKSSKENIGEDQEDDLTSYGLEFEDPEDDMKANSLITSELCESSSTERLSF